MTAARMLTCLVAFFLAATLAAIGDDAAPAKREPAILFCSWNPTQYVDFVYYQEMKKAGFRVDYLDAWSDFSLDKIKGYNAIVLFSFPAKGEQTHAPWGFLAPGWNYEKTIDAVKQYLALGGGVILDIDCLHPKEADLDASFDIMSATEAGLAEFGAQAPYEDFLIPPHESVPNPRLGSMPYFYANDVQPSPVSDGVHGLWLPNFRDGHGSIFSGPIVVDKNWTPVVRAGATIGTFAPALIGAGTFAPGALPAGLIQRKESEPNPVVFAIRSVGPGRMALFNLRPIFHVGGGTKWFYNRITLDRGLGDKPSDFGRLLQNTLRWVSEPSLGGTDLGNAVIADDRLVSDAFRPDALAHYGINQPNLGANPPPAPDAPVAETKKLFRGFVGAKTSLTGGTGSFDDYAQAARKAHLDFVVFDEDWPQLDAAKLGTMEKECARLSGPDLLLIPGYSMATNVGPRLLLYGTNLILPQSPKLISKSVPGAFALQAENDKGGYLTESYALDFLLGLTAPARRTVSNACYYDFGASRNDGRFRLMQVRAGGGGAVLLYRHGKLIENNRADYLLTNSSTMTVLPLVVAEVTSPAEMTDHVQSGKPLTQVEATSLATLLPESFNWNHQFQSEPVTASEGPTIRGWSNTVRAMSYGGEDFVNERDLITPELVAHSDNGIKEVRVYDGPELYRRFLPAGAKDFSLRLYLSAVLQRTLGVEVEDTTGHVATAFPFRCAKSDKLYVFFCGDHVNDCGGSASVVKMAHGSFWPAVYSYAYVPDPGYTWDGGPPSIVEVLPFAQAALDLRTDAAEQTGSPVQVPTLVFADERVYRGDTRAVGINLAGGNPWRGWGPIAPLPVADADARLTVFRQAATGVDASRNGDAGRQEGNASTLYEEDFTFKNDAKLTSFVQSLYSTKKIPQVHGTFIVGLGDKILGTYSLDFGPGTKAASFDIPTGAWFAGIAPVGANSVLSFNRGEPLRIHFTVDNITLQAALPEGGRPVKKGDQMHIELFTTMWTMSDNIADTDTLLKVIHYLRNPSGLEMVRGKRLTGDGGLQELAADDGAVEIRVPKQDASIIPVSLSARATGFNRNWSAGEFQLEAYNGGNYYSDGKGVFRPVGVDHEGRIYAPLYTAWGDVHTLLGHPITADDAGRALKIEVTALTGPRDGKPGSWHVSVNNPTDHAITAKLQRRMELPGLKFNSTEITLKPGEYRILEHGDIDPAQLAKDAFPAPAPQ